MPLGTADKARKVNKYRAKCPPPVSFVAIGLFVATIGFSIGLDADIFRDVAGAEVSGRLPAHLYANWGDRNATR